MQCIVCQKYLNQSISNANEFKRDFMIETLQSGPGWHSGICFCKSCGVKYSFDYENMIHEKLWLSKEDSETEKN